METSAGPGNASSTAVCKSFKKGLMFRENECPTIAGMEAMLSKGNPANQQAVNVSNNLESGHSVPVEDRRFEDCILERFEEAVRGLSEQRDAIYERAAHETVKLALAISEKVIHHEVSAAPGLILGIVREAIQKIKESQSINIKIHPDNFKALKQAGLDTAGLESSCEGFTFQTDGSLGRGDCLLETRQGNIDASIHNQLALIEKAFASLGRLPQNDDPGHGAGLA
jgi:flagellar biosynthesis/type III secretory pathway protein FliH